MCYDIKTKVEAALKRARHYGNEEAIQMLIEQFRPFLEEEFFHVSGFQHPKMLIYTREDFELPAVASWGLIPFWVKNEQQQLDIWNKTINARGETIFEKPSFRTSAKSKRCLIYIDGFFEHHHFGGKKYPFYIQRVDGEPMVLGGLWDEWTNKETGEMVNSFTIVTTIANALMKKIHNNPKLKEARMPLILNEDKADNWLNGTSEEAKAMILPATDGLLKAHTVRRLRGKEAVGNSPQAIEEFIYSELKFRA
ncbi:SOS response-associated peptidase [Draconibacterium halophilum]|uniref:Abasic site processing protein n=1 Tax=Draconibacterium halophilum TaxID=2706887 RepID=A0A6C0RBB4_9BACT|nr:SOS response-associated peptidase [Draconibacterium halophilum]QIA06763.1 SOS response-associated peptidase [Draconibacterium halophilum]